ncbi:hypothetical protein L7F22_030546 [Adiantum nelumboides]|nr:hypothetical protein [Adiantum nelumboides]
MFSRSSSFRQRTSRPSSRVPSQSTSSWRNRPSSSYQRPSSSRPPFHVKKAYCRKCRVYGHTERNCYRKFSRKKPFRQAHYVSNSPSEHESESEPDNVPSSPSTASHSSQASEEDAHLCFMADSIASPLPANVPETSWLLDTGATCNLTSDRHALHHYRTLRNPFAVRFGNNSRQYAIGFGTAHILLSDGNVVAIPKVYHIPQLAKNLISVSQIAKSGTRVEFEEGHAIIKHVLPSGARATILNQFKTFHRLAENQLEQPIKSLQTDNGGEYTSQAFEAYCSQYGIHHRLTVARNPQQNGLAERKNRSLMNSARSMLRVAALSPSFWEEAVATACYLQNRTYSRALRFIPYTLWCGKEPDYSLLKVFGYTCYAYTSPSERHKLDDHAVKSIFVGYGEPHGVKGFRLFDPIKRRFFFSRSVVFDEDSLISTPLEAPSNLWSSPPQASSTSDAPSTSSTAPTTITWRAPVDPLALVPPLPPPPNPPPVQAAPISAPATPATNPLTSHSEATCSLWPLVHST